MRRRLMAGAVLAAVLTLTGGGTGAAGAGDPEAPPGWAVLESPYDGVPPAGKVEMTAADLAAELKIGDRALRRTTDPGEKLPAAVVQHAVLTLDGRPVPGLYLRPATPGRHPAVLLLQDENGGKEAMIRRYGLDLLRHGFVLLALDAPGFGERASKAPPSWVEMIHQGVREYRAAAGWLAAQPEVDGRRIGALGSSMGGGEAVILAAVDHRIAACVAAAAGDLNILDVRSTPSDVKDELYSVCPSVYAPRLAPRPLLMINGRTDAVVPRQAAEILFGAAAAPRDSLWLDAGHALTSAAGERAAAWLEAHLKAAP